MDINKKIEAYQKNELKSWNMFYALTAAAYMRPGSEDELGQPLLCSYKIRSNVYKKNMKSAYEKLEDIAWKAIFGMGCEKEIEADNIFTILCILLDTFRRLEFFTTNQDGWKGHKISRQNALVEAISEWREKYYTALKQPAIELREKTAELKRQADIITNKIAALENEHIVAATAASAIASSLSKAQEKLQHLQDAMNTKQAEVNGLTAENRISKIIDLIIEMKGKIAGKERAQAELLKKKGELKKAIYSNDAQRDTALAPFETAERTLRQQINIAAEKLSKAFLLKRSKQEQLGQLQASLQFQMAEKASKEKEFSNTKARLTQQLSECESELDKLTQEAAASRNRVDELISLKKTSENEIESKKQELCALLDAQGRAQKKCEQIEKKTQIQNACLADIVAQKEELCTQLTVLQSKIQENDNTPLNIPETAPIMKRKYHKRQVQKKKSSLPIQSMLEAAFEKYGDLQIRLLELRDRLLYLQSREQVYEMLSSEGFIVEQPKTLAEEMKSIEQEIEQAAAELKDIVPYIGFEHTQENNEKKANALLRKADKSFDSFWNQFNDGSIMPIDIIPFSTIGHCLRIKDSFYLWFNAFYAVSVRIGKDKSVKFEVFRYSELTLEQCETNLSLQYGKPCPEDAAIVATRWQYEKADGSKNLRYKDNPSYYIVAVNTIKLTVGDETICLYYSSKEDADNIFAAFLAHTKYLTENCAEIIQQLFASAEAPDIAAAFDRLAAVKEQEAKAQKEQEKMLLAQQRAALKRREQEKQQEEARRIARENWAKLDQQSKEAEEALLQERMNSLSTIDNTILATWKMPQKVPVVITNSRRSITNGITKIEFQQENDDAAARYIVFFVDPDGKICSDKRIFTCSSIGAKAVIPLEIRTNSLNGAKLIYLLVVSFDTGSIVNRIEFKVNITFTNDFDL